MMESCVGEKDNSRAGFERSSVFDMVVECEQWVEARRNERIKKKKERGKNGRWKEK